MNVAGHDHDARAGGLEVASTVPVSFVDGPGNRFTVFLQGCNLDCFNCHNAALIGTSRAATWRSIDELLDELRPRAGFLSGVTVTGGEATLQLEGLIALFAAVRADPATRHLTTLVDSNGTLDEAGWRRLAPVMDGAMIDVKAIDEATHRRITGSGNAEVLRSVRVLHELDRLVELRLLVIEGLTDTPEELAAYAELVTSLDAATPVRIMAYRHHGVRATGLHWPETRPETMDRVEATLHTHGVRDVRATTIR